MAEQPRVPAVHDRHGPEARRALEREALIPHTKHEQEIARGLELGLQGADSIVDRTIPTFSRGELPHYAGINTFLKAPFVEDVRTCGAYDVAVLGAPHDSGTTYRPGTRFGPQGMRRISALYGTYSFELGVDLRESITICDLGDVFTIPGNIEKTFDQKLRRGSRDGGQVGVYVRRRRQLLDPAGQSSDERAGCRHDNAGRLPQ